MNIRFNSKLLKKKSPPPSKGRVRERVENSTSLPVSSIFPLPARERELKSTPPHFYRVFSYRVFY